MWPDDEQSRRFEHGTHPPVESAKAPAAQRDTVTGSMPTTAVSIREGGVTAAVRIDRTRICSRASAREDRPHGIDVSAASDVHITAVRARLVVFERTVLDEKLAHWIVRKNPTPKANGLAVFERAPREVGDAVHAVDSSTSCTADAFAERALIKKSRGLFLDGGNAAPEPFAPSKRSADELGVGASNDGDRSAVALRGRVFESAIEDAAAAGALDHQ